MAAYRRLFLQLVLNIALGLAASVGEGGEINPPPLIGVNVAGDWHFNNTGSYFYEYESWFDAADAMGVDFVDVNYLIEHVFNDIEETTASARQKLATIDASMREHDLRWLLSTDVQSWVDTLEIGGQDWVNHPDGTHRFDISMEWIDPLLVAGENGPPALLGLNHDEGEHNQLTGNNFVVEFSDVETFDKPTFLDVDGMDMEAAWAGLVERCRWLKEEQYEDRLRPMTEQTWPDMFHIFARAGWRVTPKLLKEELSSVMMACAMGAVLQYSDRSSLWVCHDLHKLDRYPGWSPDALGSSLRMGYWLGADAMYVENMDFEGNAVRHPDASSSGSLLAWRSPTEWSMTRHGEELRDFVKEYLPAHPRRIKTRDYRPRVAIIRLPDGDWGQANSDFRNRLLGSRMHPSDAISREWLQVWPILTHDVASTTGISLLTYGYENRYDFPFFVPIDSVAVFDHTVTGSVLDSVECFVVCGHALSAETFAAVAARVEQGARALIARRLYEQHAADSALPGDWVIVDDFAQPEVREALEPFRGPVDVARFRFEDFIVEFHPTDAVGDKTEVTITARNNSASGWRAYR